MKQEFHKIMATLFMYISHRYIRTCLMVVGTINAQHTNIWPPSSITCTCVYTKITQKAAYLLPNSVLANCNHSCGQRIEYETRSPSGSVRTYKSPVNQFLLRVYTLIPLPAFYYLQPLPAPVYLHQPYNLLNVQV